jgi:hypothetical protein
MDAWAATLREHFGPALSELLGLHDVVTGQDFEEHLGELTRWLALKPLNERFSWMTSGTDAGRDGVVAAYLQALEHAEERGRCLERALDESLFEQFGPGRFDGAAPGVAYNALLSAVGEGRRPKELICATTNYDRSLELALTDLYSSVRTGFSYDGIRRPTLIADGLGDFGPQPSLLYLHGAVGWYRTADGSVAAYPASDAYRPDIGRPAVLYPSRNKIVEDSAVRDIWVQFAAAVDQATHILVLGHGLADDHLVEELKRASAPLAATYFSDSGADTIQQQVLPRAHQIRMIFGSKPDFDRQALREWAASSG